MFGAKKKAREKTPAKVDFHSMLGAVLASHRQSVKSLLNALEEFNLSISGNGDGVEKKDKGKGNGKDKR